MLRDLGRIKKQWQTGGLNLEYSREDGYYVFGSEWSKRNYLLGLVNVLINERKDISFVKNICQLDSKTIQAAQHILEELEYDLNIQFSDDQVSLLTYFTPIICKRIQRGEGIDYLYEKTSFQEKLSKPQSFLKRTKVFGAFELSDEEERYFTLLILTIPFYVSLIVGSRKGNIFQSVLTGSIVIALALLMATNFAPVHTQMMEGVGNKLVEQGTTISSLDVGGKSL